MHAKFSILFVSLLFAAACGSNEPAPSGSAGTADDGGPGDGGPGDDGDGTATTGGDDGADDGVDDTGGEACVEEPADSVELLNACTNAACEPFDNAARLPLLEADGSLPPIP